MELAKDKAKQLVNTFLESLYDNGSFSFKKILYAKAKQCALIAVDEILTYQPYDIYTIEQCNNVNNYWKQVKTEINNL